MGVIFDLDQTIINSSIAYQARRNRDWQLVYSLIPKMKPYTRVVELIKAMVNQGIEVAIVTSSPRPYCTKVLNYLGITNVITVCYHDTQKHKPDPEPMLLAISKMKNQEGKKIIAIGDEENDIIAANRANILSVLAYWSKPNVYNTISVQPNVFCKDEESLIKYFVSQGINIGQSALREKLSYISII